MANLVELAQRLIQENGRQITLVRLGRPSSGNPWEGTTNPEGSPEATATLYAVFVEPESTIRLGLSSKRKELLRMSEQIAIVSPGATIDITQYESIRDGATTWKITGVEVLKPGTTTYLGYIGVAR